MGVWDYRVKTEDPMIVTWVVTLYGSKINRQADWQTDISTLYSTQHCKLCFCAV